MRLDVLNRGYGPGTKLLFALIRLFLPAPGTGRHQAGLLPAWILRLPGEGVHP